MKTRDSSKEADSRMEVWSSRWLVLVASMWLQACAGVGYVYGSYSPLIKRKLHLNQKQMNILGVAKDMGDSVGIFAGALSDVVPPWGLVLLGSLQNLVGYGGIWFIVTHKASSFLLMCILIFLGTNGETYFNTVCLVSCVRSFPRSRGPIVGILKGFTGLCGAIFTLMYAAMFAPDQAAFILLVAVTPLLVGLLVMGIIRPIPQDRREDLHDESEKLGFIYNLCLVVAAYLLVVLLVQDLAKVSETTTDLFAVVLLAFLLLPLVIPLRDTFGEAAADPNSAPPDADMPEPTKPAAATAVQAPASDLRQPLLLQKQVSSPSSSSSSQQPHPGDLYFSELEDERRRHTLPEPLLRKRLQRMQSSLYRAVAEGAVKIKRRKGPRRGEDFTLVQAVVKADFLLMFLALFCGAGSGLTAIDNLGQMGQAQGYPNAHIFVSMMSIWNFLGRVAGGFVSEWAARDHCFPRPGMMGLAQLVMAAGHLFYAMAWPGSMYIGSLLVGLGYGAHWSIVPAMASELFGLQNFGSLYNFLTVANPLGSLLFSGVIAGSIYDREAERQYGLGSNGLHCKGAVCFRLTFLIMTAVCLIGAGLSAVLVVRTRRVYAALYGKQPQPQPQQPQPQPQQQLQEPRLASRLEAIEEGRG